MPNLDGQTALITGATAGIGLVTARRLAALGAEVFLVGRDANRLQTAAETVRGAVSGARVNTLRAELSSMAEVRALAVAFRARRDKLDILVNNAGAVFQSRQETAEGLEMTFALNHMSYFLLTHELLAPLTAARAARVVNVASMAHRQGHVDFDDLQSRRSYLHMRAYGTSKLMNILFTRALARRLSGTNVITNCLHPGFVDSSFGDNNSGLFKRLISMAKTFAITPEAGADTSVYLAADAEAGGINGQYFSRCKPANCSRAARDLATSERLWDVTAALAGI